MHGVVVREDGCARLPPWLAGGAVGAAGVVVSLAGEWKAEG